MESTHLQVPVKFTGCEFGMRCLLSWSLLNWWKVATLSLGENCLEIESWWLNWSTFMKKKILLVYSVQSPNLNFPRNWKEVLVSLIYWVFFSEFTVKVKTLWSLVSHFNLGHTRLVVSEKRIYVRYIIYLFVTLHYTR